MFDLILQGIDPTEVFKRMMAAEPDLSNLEMGQRFVVHFERVEGIAMQVISKWQARAVGVRLPMRWSTDGYWIYFAPPDT